MREGVPVLEALVKSFCLSILTKMDPRLAEASQSYDSNLVLKPKQVEALQHILSFSSHRRDLIVNLPVGYGKSIIFHLLPALLEECCPSPIILVVSPLNVIQKDQIGTLHKHGIQACRLDMQGNPDVFEEEESASLFNMDKKVTLQDVRTGKYSVILSHPEALLNSQMGRDLLKDEDFKTRVAAVVIDECHVASEWGKEFRTAYANLHILPCTFPSVPHIALSGSLTVEELKTLPSTLGLKNPVVVEENPDRSNIFLSVKHKAVGRDTQTVYEDIFISESNKLHSDPSVYPVTLLFIPLFYMSRALSYLKYLFGVCDITTSVYSALFSKQSQTVFDVTIDELKKETPRIRLILCTSAVGMGFDPPSVTRIIHALPPRNLSKYLQEIGRAGRRGQRASAVLYFNKSDLRANLPGIKKDIICYCNESECLRSYMLQVFGFKKPITIKACECCSNCAKHCECDVCLVSNNIDEMMFSNEQ